MGWNDELIVFCAALALLSRRKWMEWRLEPARTDLRFVLLHLLSLALLAATEFTLIRHSALGHSTLRILPFVRDGSLLLIAGSLAAALLSPRNLGRLLRCFQPAWAYAALVTLAVMLCKVLLLAAWQTPGSHFGYVMQATTFAGVKDLLSLFYAGVVADSSTLTLGTARFQILVGAPCSGIEGLGLMLLLTIGWLVFACRELRLQRAVLLIPLSLTAMWLLNIVRIAALIVIGDAGHADIAVRGFHSLAGWLLFNAVALGFLLAANHVRWLRKDDAALPRAASVSAGDRNVAAVYLLPFLMVLTASLVGRAASSGFDWLYPLRLAVAVVMLWIFRAEYRRLDWRFSWLGPVAGSAVFGLWLGLAHRHGAGPDELGLQLARLAPWQRGGWIATRALAAIVTVPIVEELAFRGYIARRMMSADVEFVPFGRLSLLAIAVSALVFGALHGNMWIAGTIAGVVFALVAKLRGRLGEAVAAHATANLLIAAWVLARGDYRMW